jgi:uncharacterized protein
MQLRPLTPNDVPAVLALNAASVKVLSPLDAERLAWLHGMAAVRDVVEIEGEVGAFVLALREGTAYDSPNYRWFAERHPRFLYVDRIVVGAALRGRQVGARLYAQVFASAQAAGVPWVTCEFDRDPPNPASAQFHARFGFKEVGQQWVAGGTKQVSLQAAPVAGGPMA